jgi:hypothetical protein
MKTLGSRKSRSPLKNMGRRKRDRSATLTTSYLIDKYMKQVEKKEAAKRLKHREAKRRYMAIKRQLDAEARKEAEAKRAEVQAELRISHLIEKCLEIEEKTRATRRFLEAQRQRKCMAIKKRKNAEVRKEEEAKGGGGGKDAEVMQRMREAEETYL